MKHLKTYENFGFITSLDEMIYYGKMQNNISTIDENRNKSVSEKNKILLKQYYNNIDPYMMMYLQKNRNLIEEIETFNSGCSLAQIKFIDINDKYFKNYSLDGDEMFQVCYFYRKTKKTYSSAYFTKKDMVDFIFYMKGPEMYDDINKYNI